MADRFKTREEYEKWKSSRPSEPTHKGNYKKEGAPGPKRSHILALLLSILIILFLFFVYLTLISGRYGGSPNQIIQRPVQEKEVVIPELPVDLLMFTNNFKKMTEVQQKDLAKEIEWKYYTRGSGMVSQVEYAGFMSQITGSYYEVTVELPNGNRAIVFYPKTDKYDWVWKLSKGSYIEFKGRLKTIKNWGLWVSVYILGD